jgi:hypothetical protein
MAELAAFTLNPEVVEALNRIVAQTHENKSEIIRRLILAEDAQLDAAVKLVTTEEELGRL